MEAILGANCGSSDEIAERAVELKLDWVMRDYKMTKKLLPRLSFFP